MSNKLIYPELFGPEGHLNEEGTALFVDALFLGKTDRLPGVILDHVSNCEECRKEVAGLYDLVSENKALYPSVVHPLLDMDQENSSRKNPSGSGFHKFLSSWSVAATIILLLGIGGAFLLYHAYFNPYAQIRREIVGKIKPEARSIFRTQGETLQYAENKPVPIVSGINPKLEAMFNLQLRGKNFKLKSPQRITTVRTMERISWEWESSGPIKKLTLMVMDVAGINRDQFNLEQKKYEFIVDLPPGLYYWVIIGDGTLISVGKFNVVPD